MAGLQPKFPDLLKFFSQDGKLFLLPLTSPCMNIILINIKFMILGDKITPKMGAEAVYCCSLNDTGLGLVLKCRDGSRRAVEFALILVKSSLPEILFDDQLVDTSSRKRIGHMHFLCLEDLN